MGIRFQISLLLCLFLFATKIYPQTSWNAEFFTQDDGLSHSTITDIVQDKYGFIWLGTDNGLIRYDGYEFNAYSLHTPVIYNLLIDSDRRLWIIADSLYRFNYDKDLPEKIEGINERIDCGHVG